MTNDLGVDIKKPRRIHQRSPRHGHEVLPPDVKRKPGVFRARNWLPHQPPGRRTSSGARSSVFGFAAIKGVQEIAVESIFSVRRQGG